MKPKFQPIQCWIKKLKKNQLKKDKKIKSTEANLLNSQPGLWD